MGDVSESFNGKSFYLTEHKKSRTLKDRNGKEVKVTDVSALNSND
jgi:hypothetical protein